MSKDRFLSHAEIARATAAHFGQTLVRLTAPGGRSRTSLRAYFADRTVIVSQRRNTDQARTEAAVLQELDGAEDHAPRFLGRSGTLFFQSDVGPNRLNWAIHATRVEDRPALAAQAVDAIFALHRAARCRDMAPILPTGGLLSYPDDDLIAMVPEFATQMKQPVPDFDPARLSPLFTAPPRHFVKWDCRAGNAALGDDGRVRWFDFEESRLAQGPEDFAWLIADETWPVEADLMLDLIAAGLSRDAHPDPVAFMTFLTEFTTLHAARRVRLIFHAAKNGGWQDRVTILKTDRVGTNPHMGERLCLRAAGLARKSPATLPLVPLFDIAASVFRRVRQPPPEGGIISLD